MDERVRAWLEVAIEEGTVPTIPTVTVAEAWQGGRSARIARLLGASTIEVLDTALAKDASLLRLKVPGSGVVDAIVVASAARRRDIVLTTDPKDLSLLAEYAPGVRIEAV